MSAANCDWKVPRNRSTKNTGTSKMRASEIALGRCLMVITAESNEYTVATAHVWNVHTIELTAWPAILSVCKQAGVSWHIIEQDRCQRDPFEACRISLENLRALGVA